MATINDLPNEILLHIFTYLRWRLKPVSCVCRRWDCQLSNLQVLTLCSGIETISFEEHDKFATLKTCTLNCTMNDVPQLPVARNLTILKPTGDRFYARLIFRAPNLTHLVVEKDIFLNSESIVSICTGLRQLTDLRLKIHPKAQLALKAFRSIHLLKKLQHFYISLEDITQQRWLGCWFKKLYAPSVSIECEDFKLLLANRRTRVLRLKRINVAEWHRTGSVRRETAQLRPDLQLLYLDPVQRMWF
ncbi:hypothetical protein pipiens_007602 [Culex pipiens pipiens]|uniref:F-box domain-containing protein n=1 Tax=Culex pipiens pipiens TaxID=38569 RepID=A0ABD1DKH9_CULPP